MCIYLYLSMHILQLTNLYLLIVLNINLHCYTFLAILRHPEVPDPRFDDDGGDEDNLSVASAVSSDSEEDNGEASTADNDDVAIEATSRVIASTAKGKGVKRRPALASPSRASIRKKSKVSHFTPPKLRNRPPTDPPSKRISKKGNKDNKKSSNPTVAKEEKIDVKSDNVLVVLAQLMKQQSEILEIMHMKSFRDACPDEKDNVEEVSAKKEKQSRAAKSNGTLLDRTPIRGTEYTVPSPHVDHDMESFMRNNLQVARLIDENVELRRDKLIRDMVFGASAYLK